ncbi:pyridoxamine 5'-phosphate oxidase family protein [Flavobacterium sp. xlx-214]|uniref:pyridoxamine 5'-phosphate oxidase family protein n=1 Tax=unclassified Flavobacterium TaxID=196869 RepID=UPI0013D7099F|nr:MULTISPECIES: pyridoxamine 5'-phosphate oxidase family protein [unclassified Flavobacterium]MBA5791586.1 pyridoxamine 5'-phosphate oxidase family protein [Flavobacterium sp. xlx-221]QMI82834.1 pyridoxamine 5'-phosphate oxidase family protein [Flavobacterium sp. xlx-214]
MSEENLKRKEALEKLQLLINKIDIGMLCTYPTSEAYVHAVPMSRQEVDEEGCIWYLFSKDSQTYKNIKDDNKVSIQFADIGNYTFLSVNGNAEISDDIERIKRYWNKFVEAWFEKGIDDPNIRILKIEIKDAHYWDNKTNKLVTFFKVASSAITGKNLDIGREGALDL